MDNKVNRSAQTFILSQDCTLLAALADVVDQIRPASFEFDTFPAWTPLKLRTKSILLELINPVSLS